MPHEGALGRGESTGQEAAVSESDTASASVTEWKTGNGGYFSQRQEALPCIGSGRGLMS